VKGRKVAISIVAPAALAVAVSVVGLLLARGAAAEPEPPEPSDLRIELVKPPEIKEYVLPLVASDTNAVFGWVGNPEEIPPHRLYRFALENAVPVAEWGWEDAEKQAVPYVAGTIPGYVGPFDTYEVSGCGIRGSVVTFTVKSVRLGAGYGSISSARAYYTVLVSALPPGTKAVEIHFEQRLRQARVEGGVLREDVKAPSIFVAPRQGVLRVPIEDIRRDNYFRVHSEYGYLQ